MRTRPDIGPSIDRKAWPAMRNLLRPLIYGTPLWHVYAFIRRHDGSTAENPRRHDGSYGWPAGD